MTPSLTHTQWALCCRHRRRPRHRQPHFKGARGAAVLRAVIRACRHSQHAADEPAGGAGGGAGHRRLSAAQPAAGGVLSAFPQHTERCAIERLPRNAGCCARPCAPPQCRSSKSQIQAKPLQLLVGNQSEVTADWETLPSAAEVDALLRTHYCGTLQRTGTAETGCCLVHSNCCRGRVLSHALNLCALTGCAG